VGSDAAPGVSILVAFTAGLLSFLSPCVLPLIPSYVGYLTGMSADQIQARRGLALLHAVWFVAGFAAVFVALGATASAVGSLFRASQVWLGRVGGVLMIALGLYLLGVVKAPFLLRERKIELAHKPVGYLGSAIVGVTFGAAWSVLVLYATEHLGLGSIGFGLITTVGALGSLLGTTRLLIYLRQRLVGQNH